MSAAVRTEPGTDVALSSASVGILPPEIQRALEMRKLQNQVAGQLASMNWGKALDLPTRRAMADWGQTMGVDVATEIDVLGNNIYLNARFYLRKLGEMIAAGLVEYAYTDHVEHDERLLKLGAEGEGETSRRLRERLRHGLDDKAASAVVFRVKLRGMAREVTGAKQCGNGVRKGDPVGEQFPVETSESRAARRCMRLITSHVPPRVANQLEAIESSAEILSERIEHARREVRESNARIEAPPAGRSRVPAGSMPLLNAADPYSEVDTSRTTEMETVGRNAPVRVITEPGTRVEEGTRIAVGRPSAPASELEGSTGGGVEEIGGLNREPSASSLAGPALYPMPFTWEGFAVKTPIGQVPREPLERAVAWAKKSNATGRHMEFIQAGEMHLDDRKNGDAVEPQI